MNRRRGGTTLVEVLVAIFIMAIGLMTLLTLFPLGALSMSQAIKDTRTGHAAANAAALGEALNIRSRVLYNGTTPMSVDLDPFRNPTPGVLPNLGNTANYSGPSYPVLVDPAGFFLTQSPLANLADGIPRRTIFAPPNVAAINRLFVLQDDMNFLNDGTYAGLPCAQGAPAGSVQREGRYSWSYLVRWPRATDWTQATDAISKKPYISGLVTDLTVIVYNGRPAQLPLAEVAIPNVTLDPTSTQVTLPNGVKPDIRKGSWVLDATLYKPSGNQKTPEPHGFFYRVVGVTDNGNSLTLELQDKPKLGAAGYGVLVFMENVVEVFEKGAGWKP